MSGFQELVVEGFGEEITEDIDYWDDAHRGKLEILQQKEEGKYKEDGDEFLLQRKDINGIHSLM